MRATQVVFIAGGVKLRFRQFNALLQSRSPSLKPTVSADHDPRVTRASPFRAVWHSPPLRVLEANYLSCPDAEAYQLLDRVAGRRLPVLSLQQLLVKPSFG